MANQTLSNQILSNIKIFSCNQNVDKEVIFSAVENAFKLVACKKYPYDKIEVSFNRNTCEFEVFSQREIVADDTQQFNPYNQILLKDIDNFDIKSTKPIKIGDLVKVVLTGVEFRRKDIRLLQQKIATEVQLANQRKIAKQYAGKLNHIIFGTVKKLVKHGIIFDLGNEIEAFMPYKDNIPQESMQIGVRKKVYLYDVSIENNKLNLLVSRSHCGMLKNLLGIEIPEIRDEIIQIKAIAREPGIRAKVAVKTNHGKIDPVGTCIGLGASRIQAVSNELNGERVDLFLWNDNPAQLLVNAISPAEVLSIEVDEEFQTMNLAVQEEQLAAAIGRNGQNIRLVSEILGWKLNIMTQNEFEKYKEGEQKKIEVLFQNRLSLSKDISDILIREGFSSLEEIAYTPLQELEKIEEFHSDFINDLRRRVEEELSKQGS